MQTGDGHSTQAQIIQGRRPALLHEECPKFNEVSRSQCPEMDDENQRRVVKGAMNKPYSHVAISLV